jgi:hypothetical protein
MDVCFLIICRTPHVAHGRVYVECPRGLRFRGPMNGLLQGPREGISRAQGNGPSRAQGPSMAQGGGPIEPRPGWPETEGKLGPRPGRPMRAKSRKGHCRPRLWVARTLTSCVTIHGKVQRRDFKLQATLMLPGLGDMKQLPLYSFLYASKMRSLTTQMELLATEAFSSSGLTTS